MAPGAAWAVSTCAVALLGVSGFSGVSAESADAKSATGFCGKPMVRNFERPFARLPELRSLPQSGRLPFRPVVEVGSASRFQRSVAVGGESFGYELSDRSFGQLRKRLDWLVVVRLSRVDRLGRIVAIEARRRQRTATLHSLRKAQLLFRVPRRVATYRYDIAFVKRRGKRVLGRFGEYIRVMKPMRRARMRINRSVYPPGGTILSRVDNLGTEVLVHGVSYSVQRSTGTGWTQVYPGPDTPPLPPAIFQVLVPAGTAGPCWRFSIPVDFELGRYRVVQSVGFGLRGVSPRAATRSVIAEFNVAVADGS